MSVIMRFQCITLGNKHNEQKEMKRNKIKKEMFE